MEERNFYLQEIIQEDRTEDKFRNSKETKRSDVFFTD